MPLFAFTDADRWVPGIGDPTFMGWLTVLAYFIAFFLCLRVALGMARGQRAFFFWGALALLMFALGVNKQLDLQTWFTLFVKRLAKSEGWYEQRRLFQFLFIMLMAAGGGGLLAWLRWVTRKSVRNTSFALAGAVFLGTFILIRAASFHHVDLMLGSTIGGVRMNWILELGGIGLVSWGAWKNLQMLRRAKGAGTSFVWVTAGNRPGP